MLSPIYLLVNLHTFWSIVETQCYLFHKLIKVTTPYQVESSLVKSIEQSTVTLSIAEKMLERMRKNQKRAYEGRKTTHQFKVGDLVLYKKHAQEKLDIKWEPNYRIIRLPTAWTAVIEPHSKWAEPEKCNVGDLQKKHPHEDWQLKASNVGRAAQVCQSSKQST